VDVALSVYKLGNAVDDSLNLSFGYHYQSGDFITAYQYSGTVIAQVRKYVAPIGQAGRVGGRRPGDVGRAGGGIRIWTVSHNGRPRQLTTKKIEAIVKRTQNPTQP
jgi:hypothetical protein